MLPYFKLEGFSK